MGKISTSLPNASITLDRSSSSALYRQLYDQLRAAILSGQLTAGMRLPSTRELADELDLARNTVMNAFDQLYAESYLERRVGDGTYVSRQLPDDLLRTKSQHIVWEGSKGERASLSRWGTAVASMSIAPAITREGLAPFARAPRPSTRFLTSCGDGYWPDVGAIRARKCFLTVILLASRLCARPSPRTWLWCAQSVAFPNK